MLPIQLWLPTLSDSLSRSDTQRDAQRAMRAWKGEARIWLLPALKKEVLWYEPTGSGNTWFPVRAIPAECLERVDVIHIGENGQAWGLGSAGLFPAGRTDSLLRSWLTLFSGEQSVSMHPANEAFTLQVPRIRGTKIKYRKVRFRRMPGPTLPIVKVEKGSRMVWLRWPPESGMPAPISPEAESVQHYGPLERIDRKGLPTAISRRNPQIRSLHYICRLPGPLNNLVPFGVGMDTLYGYAQMREIVQLSAIEPETALQKAKDAATLYLSEGQTTQAHAWFLPMLVSQGLEVTMNHALVRLNPSVHRTTEELLQSRYWQQEMGKVVPIRRIWGLLGLLWALLLAQLQEGRRFVACERCGQLFSGKRGKRFCGEEDNKNCFKKRRAADRRTERTKRVQTIH